MNYKHNSDFCKAFGEHVRKLREENGFGLREFARTAEIEYSQLSRIEKGITNPTISTVLTIAEAFGVSHTELFQFKFASKSK